MQNKKHSFLHWFVGVLIALAVLGLATVGVVYAATLRMSKNAVPIVAQPPQLEEATPIPTPELQVIEGEPADIGEDVDEPMATTQPEQPIYQQIPIQEDVVNVLVVGRDARPNETGRGRSDTMMVLSYDRKSGKASIVSLMRDSWVPIQGSGWNRINATYSFGGIGLTINTVNKLFNLDVQNYVIMDFVGMMAMVDQIGGVDVPITQVEADYYNSHNGWNISAGMNHLNGDMALVHARNRKSNGGDFERVRRQQDIMLAIFQKLQSQHDPVALSKVVKFALTQVETNMSPNMIFSLSLDAVGNSNLNIQKGRMPADKTWKYANMDGRSVLSIDINKNKEYIHNLLYGTK